MIVATALLAALLSNPFAPKTKASAAPAAVPAPIPDVPPRGFPGYAHPEVTAAMCKVINTGKTQCVLPAMTAGRYIVEAVGLSTALPPPTAAPVGGAAAPAPPPNAVQAIAIFTGDRLCGRAQGEPWSSGVHVMRLSCEITIVADAPFPITVSYADANATMDPRGPGITIRRLPWDGVITAQAFVPQP